LILWHAKLPKSPFFDFIDILSIYHHLTDTCDTGKLCQVLGHSLFQRFSQCFCKESVMPVYSTDGWDIDYAEVGTGSPVVLIHSSVSGNQQWRSLTESLKERYRVLAANLFGYGETTPWPETAMQTLADHADLVLTLCSKFRGRVFLVGHSFGGSVALKAALRLGRKVAGLVLLEPNPFYLLSQHKREAAYEEAKALRDHIKQYGAAGDWHTVAERFADYFVGDGAWEGMPAKRQSAYLEAMPPNFHEWDAVMNETTTIDTWASIKAKTLVVYAADTKRPLREIVELFVNACAYWSFTEIAGGGHMAPLFHPELVNPIVTEFLNSIGDSS
jgi:pimeloyl-ACP methyl ester carboxylesterase